MANRSIAGLLAIALTGCGFVSYEDVGEEAHYASYLGTEYRTTSELQLYRVSLDPNYGSTPSVYMIVAAPGFSGPEVLSKEDLPAGAALTIQSVERCTNCFLDLEPRVHMVARLVSPHSPGGLEVQVDLDVLSEHMEQVTDHASGS